MEIQLPEGVTQKDLEAFLKRYQTTPSRPTRTRNEYPDYCSQCNNHDPIKGYCIVSCECSTQVLNQECPSRFVSRKEAEEWKSKYLKV